MNTNFSVELFFPWKYVLLNVKQLNSLWLQNSNAKSLIPTFIFFLLNNDNRKNIECKQTILQFSLALVKLRGTSGVDGDLNEMRQEHQAMQSEQKVCKSVISFFNFVIKS